MDEADRAQAHIEQLEAAALMRLAASRRAASACQAHAACRECGEPIPTPRRLALPGVSLCVECKAEEERR